MAGPLIGIITGNGLSLLFYQPIGHDNVIKLVYHEH